MSVPTRALGPLRVSEVGLGCNNFGRRLDADASAEVVHAALEEGITLFDTADSYGGGESEVFLGQALGGDRDSVIVATKFGFEPRDASAGNVVASCEASLRRLGTDRIDLFQIHFPDPATPLQETLAALASLVAAGKVRYVGCSNFDVALLDEAYALRDVLPVVSVQNELSLLARVDEAEVLPWCLDHQTGYLPYFPLAGGLLTGKYRRGAEAPAGARWTVQSGPRRDQLVTEANLDVVEALVGFCERHGRTMVELAFSWLLTRPGLSSVIAGATSPEQVVANVAAASWELTEEDLAEIHAITAR
ncbi:aldo/keto reductase [Pseudactinotalea suaedae]|uniref:aldo/keto reductase n=1 Tax=Pseudactinotalea suaedae TaxID=1524924 RepID=UPI0012E1398F|nr:aldo/keto reductase [Pseudactinotalea suaedae]